MLKDRHYEPLKLLRPISPVLDVSSVNQVLCAGNDPDINRRIEPMLWCKVSIVKQQGEILRKINRPNTGCLANPIHFYRAQNEYRDIDNLPAGSLKYCQLCDITAEMPDTMDGILYQACNANLALTMSPLDHALMYLENMVAVLNAAGEH